MPRTEPAKVTLSPRQLAAAFQLAGLKPPRHLAPSFPPLADPQAELAGSGHLRPEGNLIDPLAGLLPLLANPGRVVSVLAGSPGDLDWQRTKLVAPAEGGPFVFVGQGDGRVELLRLGSDMEAAALIDENLGLTSFPSRARSGELRLSLASWAILLASTDVLREHRLSSELAREIEAPSVTDDRFDPSDLHAMLEEGLKHEDTRWAVTLARPLTPRDLGPVLEQLQEGLDALVASGLLLTEGQDVYGFSPRGAQVARLLAHTVRAGVITLQFRSEQELVRVGEFTVFRSPLGLLAGFWTDLGSPTPQLQLVEPDGPSAVALVRRILQRTNELPETRERTSSLTDSPTAACTNCHQPLDPDTRFCTDCGEKHPQPQARACDSCGTVVPDPSTRFCPQCGNALPPASASPICSRCQQPLEPGQRFCSHCGVRRGRLADGSAAAGAPGETGEEPAEPPSSPAPGIASPLAIGGLAGLFLLALVVAGLSEEVSAVMILGVIPVLSIALALLAQARWWVMGLGGGGAQLGAFASCLLAKIPMDGEGYAIFITIASVNAGLCAGASALRSHRAARRFDQALSSHSDN